MSGPEFTFTPDQPWRLAAEAAPYLLDSLGSTMGANHRGVISRLIEHVEHLDGETQAKVADAARVLLSVFDDPWTTAEDPDFLYGSGLPFPEDQGECQPCRESHARIEHGCCVMCHEPIRDYRNWPLLLYCDDPCPLILAEAKALRARPS